jgi:hypothetical protein
LSVFTCFLATALISLLAIHLAQAPGLLNPLPHADACSYTLS